ncbi:MAG: PDZ domain-containing protein [Bacteroidota bacterium]
MKKQIFSLLTLLCLFTTTITQAQSWYGWNDDDDDEPFLGVQSDQISDEKAEILGFDNPYGSYVSKVLAGTAAEKAGIQPFDYIYGIDGEWVDDDDGLTELIDDYDAGDKVKIHLVRKGKKMTVNATFGTRSDRASSSRVSKNEQAFLGINRHSRNNDDELGVRIYPVSNSTAASMGLRSGDVITSINGYPIIDWDDISTAIDNAEVGSEMVVEYTRERAPKRASAPVQSYAATKSYKSKSKSNKSRAFLGIYSDKLSRSKAQKLGFENRHGSYVSGIIGNTAAEQAGLQPFDYIYGIDEYRTNENQSLTGILRKYYEGEKATLYLVRNEQNITVPVTFGNKAKSKNKNKNKCQEPFLGIRQNTSSPSDRGVRVDIVKSSTAMAMNMEDGDIVTSINGYRMIDWEDIGTAIDNMTVGEPIKVEWIRDGQPMRSSEPIKSQCDTEKDRSWDFNFNEDFSFGFNDNDDDDNYRGTRGRPDISNMQVEVSDVDASEAANLRRNYGVEMPTTNNLNVQALKMTPNASKGLFDLEFDLPDTGETTVRIFNNAGRIIYNYELGNFSGDFQDEVDISQNGTGTYYLEIRQDAKSTTKKLVLQGG